MANGIFRTIVNVLVFVACAQIFAASTSSAVNLLLRSSVETVGRFFVMEVCMKVLENVDKIMPFSNFQQVFLRI